jgi:hypothetical protein
MQRMHAMLHWKIAEQAYKSMQKRKPEKSCAKTRIIKGQLFQSGGNTEVGRFTTDWNNENNLLK